MQVPILTYHAGIISSNDYLGNDHIALRHDLQTLRERGWRVVPLQWVIENRLGIARHDLKKCVAITCDDGTDLDFHDIDYPGFGLQRSFMGCLQDAKRYAPDVHQHLHISAFVIADPVARALMDEKCLQHLNWMNETWWKDAQGSGLMSIECHSWDHNHPVLADTGPENMARGDFFQVDTEAKAKHEIDQAIDYINQRIAPKACKFFCYPYGHANHYLINDYLPTHGPGLGILAAFGVQGEPATMQSTIWHMPRYVCGWHWKSSDELQRILEACIS
jgi:peptidoglycan/xylan/chitin deacetylase (PgdA/CDA1 family)